jgi:hypothetical protein
MGVFTEIFMKYRLSILSLLLVTLLFTINLLALDDGCEEPDNLVNTKGWKIAGIQTIDDARITKKYYVTVEHRQIQVTVFDPRSVNGNRELIICKDSVIYEESSMIAKRITRYEAGGKAFCYLVTMSPIDHRPGALVADVIAAEFNYAYYDDDGTGLFKMREWASLAIGFPNMWHVRMPEWAKRAIAEEQPGAPPLSEP